MLREWVRSQIISQKFENGVAQARPHRYPADQTSCENQGYFFLHFWSCSGMVYSDFSFTFLVKINDTPITFIDIFEFEKPLRGAHCEKLMIRLD